MILVVIGETLMYIYDQNYPLVNMKQIWKITIWPFQWQADSSQGWFRQGVSWPFLDSIHRDWGSNLLGAVRQKGDKPLTGGHTVYYRTCG